MTERSSFLCVTYSSLVAHSQTCFPRRFNTSADSIPMATKDSLDLVMRGGRVEIAQQARSRADAGEDATSDVGRRGCHRHANAGDAQFAHGSVNVFRRTVAGMEEVEQHDLVLHG